MAVIAVIAQIEAVAASQPRRAAAPDRPQAVQGDALIEHLRAMLGAQPGGVQDGQFAGPHGRIPEQAGGNANGEREQCFVQEISDNMRSIVNKRDFRQG